MKSRFLPEDWDSSGPSVDRAPRDSLARGLQPMAAIPFFFFPPPRGNRGEKAAESCLGTNPVPALAACHSLTRGKPGPDGRPASDGWSPRRRHCLSVFRPQPLCSGPPRGANGGPQSSASNLSIVFPNAHQNMPHDPYQAAFKVNIHPTIYYHKLSQRIRP